MSSAALIHLVSFVHALVLVAWAGVVATEAVLELYPLRRPDLHVHTIRFHFWIDLLVELPLVVAVVGSGITLAALCWPLSPVHWVKIACVVLPVGSNLACVGLVIRRKLKLDAGAPEADLWRTTRRIMYCAAAALPFAAIAATLGFSLASQRLAVAVRRSCGERE